MRIAYPKSFLKLVLLGLLLVLFPTLVVLSSIVVSVEQLTRRSQSAVEQATQATQASRRIGELLTAMERNARQYAILADAGMLDAYRSNRERLTQTLESFSRQMGPYSEQIGLVDLARAERSTFAILSDPASDKAALNEAIAGFASLSALAQTIVTSTNDRIAADIDSLRQAGQDMRAILVWELLALAPAMIVLVVGSTLTVARPIREIDGAIRRMGAGDFTTAVSVGGPEDLRYLGRQLDWLRLRIGELEQQRSKFLQHVSHELKTPLTALREGSELLAGGMTGALNAEQREIAEILRQHSLQLQRLIEDLLNYAQLQSQQPELSPAPVKLKEVIDRAVAAQNVAMRSKDLRLTAECPEVTLSGDAKKLWIVVDNLLSNAIKFSPAGGEVKLKVAQTRDNVVLDVLDSGPGLTSSDQERVFEPFYRGAAARDSRIKGTGLGLSIVREYVVAHGGCVEVVDAGSSGGHLRVMLPRLSTGEKGHG